MRYKCESKTPARGLPVGIPNKWTVELELELTADP
jgi:hypothetical protein